MITFSVLLMKQCAGILLCLGSLFLMSSLSFAQGKAPGSRQYAIDSCVNEFSLSRIESTQAGYQYWFVDKEFVDGRTLKMSVVGPHQATHPPHHHPEDEFFFILEGKAEFFLDGKTKTAGAYSSFYCPPNSEHGIRNAGDSEMKYLVIKKYEKKRTAK